MRIVFWGNSARGVACLERVLAEGFDVVAVVGQTTAPGAAREVLDIARERNLPYYAPAQAGDPELLAALRDLRPDLFILAGYARILPPAVLAIPPHGSLNLHGGRLPEYRGGSPLNWQIINGEREIGISIIMLDAGIDTGPLVNERRIPLTGDMGYTEVQAATLRLFPDMLVEALRALAANTLRPRPQDESRAAYYTKRYQRDGLIRWERLTAVQVHNLVRALTAPCPGAFARRGGETIIIHCTRLLEETVHGPAGRVALRRGDAVIVCAADRGLLVEEVSVNGVRQTAGAAFKLGDDLG